MITLEQEMHRELYTGHLVQYSLTDVKKSEKLQEGIDIVKKAVRELSLARIDWDKEIEYDNGKPILGQKFEFSKRKNIEITII